MYQRKIPLVNQKLPQLNERGSALARQVPSGTIGKAEGGIPAPAIIGMGSIAAQNIAKLSQATTSQKISNKERDEIISEKVERESNLQLLTITKSAISLYSWKEMQQIAQQIKITNDEIKGKGSVNDPRMGVVSLNTPCQLCSQIDCPGHFGLINFEGIKIYNPAYIREVVSVLSCVCNDCGGLLLTEDDIRQQGFHKFSFEKRLTEMETYCKDRIICLRDKPQLEGGEVKKCKKNHEFITVDVKEKGEISYKTSESVIDVDNGEPTGETQSGTRVMPIEKVMEILDRISPEDAHLLGFPRSPSPSKLNRDFVLNILESLPQETLIRFGFEANVREMDYEEILNILEMKVVPLPGRLPVTDSVLREFGFPQGSHPRNMIMQGLLVPPVIARPPVYEGGSVHHDQLTYMYKFIFQKVEKINSGKDVPASLYTAVKQLIFKTEGKKMGTHEFISIIERLQGKGALLRNLLMGKRDDYCGRTVAGPDACLRYGQIRIPEVWAPILTKKIRVTDFNIHNLTALLEAGKITHITQKSTGLRRYYNPKFRQRLRVGDQVDRWLQNGDRIVVNRQPTLHRQSIMSYEVVLGKPLTIGLHLSYTSPMNCDFDGDENNAWDPQDFEVEAECELILNVQNNVMSTHQNKPIMGLVMNSVSGAYLLTTPDKIDTEAIIKKEYLDSFLSKPGITDEEITLINNSMNRYVGSNFSSIINSTKNLSEYSILYKLALENGHVIEGTRIDDILFSELLTLITDQTPISTLYQRLIKYGVHPRSGQAIFSAMLPPDFKYSHKGVIIMEGILVSGRLTKSHVGASSRSIIQELWKNYGPMRTSNFFTDAPWVIGKWLIEHGFSVGILDCVNLAKDKSTGEEYDENKRILDQELAKIYVQLEALGGKLDEPIEEIYRQRKINNLVNIANGIGLRLAQEVLSGDNSIGVMTDQGAGTKGGIANIGQMMGSVGQQFYRGQRLKPSITGGKRLLPTYDPDDNNPVANAFIPVSFFTGLSPEALFFLQAGGREGILDTALKTADTGSMQHRMIKALENIITTNDGSVRNTIGTMFSPMYNSGYDIAEMVAVENPGKSEFASFIDLKTTVSSLNNDRGWVSPSFNSQILKQRISISLQNPTTETILPTNNPDYIPSSPLVTNTQITYDVTDDVPSPSPLIKLSKFEKARIVGTRATQLSNNAPPLVDIGDELDPVKIAIKEYNAGVLQIYVIRKFPDGSYQTVYPTLDHI